MLLCFYQFIWGAFSDFQYLLSADDNLNSWVPSESVSLRCGHIVGLSSKGS